MKILISDYPEVLASRNLAYEQQLLHSLLPEAVVEIYAYQEQEEFLTHLSAADVLITAFLEIDEQTLVACSRLKGISVNATGFNTIDVATATRLGIKVVPLVNYCTQEVADHTLAFILALVRKIKKYQRLVDDEQVWEYAAVGNIQRISTMTLALYGLGRIGQAVAVRAQAFGMTVVAVDPYLPKAVAESLGVELVDDAYVFQHAQIISNHMNATNASQHYFDAAFFQKVTQKPIFINMARGVTVDEQALIKALDAGQITGAGLDVLSEEAPELTDHPLLNRDNVLITPHGAFYSAEALQDLQRISCENAVKILRSGGNEG